MDEEGRYVVVMEVKTVVADKRTCLLSERSARRVEDGGRGGKGGGVSSGQGERTTETVSHTVPNMAAADQFPHQSIARNTRPAQTKFFFFFLSSSFCGERT